MSGNVWIVGRRHDQAGDVSLTDWDSFYEKYEKDTPIWPPGTERFVADKHGHLLLGPGRPGAPVPIPPHGKPKKLRAGEIVRITGSKEHAGFNGHYGRLYAYDKVAEAWGVEFPGGLVRIKVPANNLTLSDRDGATRRAQSTPPQSWMSRVSEKAVNAVEHATGIDLDGDGDVGLPGHKNAGKAKGQRAKTQRVPSKKTGEARSPSKPRKAKTARDAEEKAQSSQTKTAEKKGPVHEGSHADNLAGDSHGHGHGHGHGARSHEDNAAESQLVALRRQLAAEEKHLAEEKNERKETVVYMHGTHSKEGHVMEGHSHEMEAHSHSGKEHAGKHQRPVSNLNLAGSGSMVLS